MPLRQVTGCPLAVMDRAPWFAATMMALIGVKDMEGGRVARIKRLSKSLTYRRLSSFVGKSITITDYQSLGETLITSLGLPSGCELIGPAQKNFIGAASKYGIIDATFTGPSDLLSGEDVQRGVPLLRQLGFLPDTPAEAPLEDEVMACLDEVANQVAANKTFVRLFLETPRLDLEHAIDAIRRDELPPRYLPRVFKVEDACATNSDHVWMWKHFYL